MNVLSSQLLGYFAGLPQQTLRTATGRQGMQLQIVLCLPTPHQKLHLVRLLKWPAADSTLDIGAPVKPLLLKLVVSTFAGQLHPAASHGVYYTNCPILNLPVRTLDGTLGHTCC